MWEVHTKKKATTKNRSIHKDHSATFYCFDFTIALFEEAFIEIILFLLNISSLRESQHHSRYGSLMKISVSL